MKKKIFSLMICIVIFAIGPLFAMETEPNEDSKKSNFIFRLFAEGEKLFEEVAEQYEDSKKCIPDVRLGLKKLGLDDLFKEVGLDVAYCINRITLLSFMEKPYESTWCPYPHLFDRKETDKSYSFSGKQTQFELYVRGDGLKKLEEIPDGGALLFLSKLYWVPKPIEGKSCYKVEFEDCLDSGSTFFIRELKPL